MMLNAVSMCLANKSLADESANKNKMFANKNLVNACQDCTTCLLHMSLLLHL